MEEMVASFVLSRDVALDICSFCDSRDLASVELAGVNAAAAVASWKSKSEAARTLFDDVWKLQSWPALPSFSKAGLRALNERCQQINQVPESWAPFIKRFSVGCLKGYPRPRSSEKSTSGELYGPPTNAPVSLAPSAAWGDRWSIGVSMKADQPGCIGDGCLLAVEVLGKQNSRSREGQISFAPSSGRCYMAYPKDTVVMVAQVLPETQATDESGKEICEQIEAWVKVSEGGGGITFCRRCASTGRIEESGEIPKNALPHWSKRLHPCIEFRVDALPMPVQVEVTWIAEDLPPPASHVPDFEFGAVWAEFEGN